MHIILRFLMDFVFANKSIRTHIFENPYDKQIKQVNKIRKYIFKDKISEEEIKVWY